LKAAVGTPARPTTAAPVGTSLIDTFGPLLLGLILLIAAVAIGFLAYNRLAPQLGTRSRRVTERESTVYEDLPTTAPSAAQAMPPAAATGGAPTMGPSTMNVPASSGAATNPVMTSSAGMNVPTRSAPPTRTAATRAAPPPATQTLGTFAATYKFGDDSYDTSFTLETPRGEFLGECGMGISELIGEGKPDKVTAFDVWLFDKTDVRTVTQILMSEHAFNDLTLRNRLAPKGELMLAEKGKHLLLETATLRVDAEIVDLTYASTPGLPPNSHFQRLIVEMVANQKPT
jgi:Flp pilus assembly protein TadG